MKNEEFEKWADENLMYGGDRWAAFQGYQMRQPEIDALTEEVALCHGTLDSRTRNIETLMKENAALQAEVGKLRADAERLDWLEAHPRLGEIHVDGEVKDYYLYAVSGALGVPMRAIIDATKEMK